MAQVARTYSSRSRFDYPSSDRGTYYSAGYYSSSAVAVPSRQTKDQPRPNVRVHIGQRSKNPNYKTLPEIAPLIFKSAIVLIFIVAVLLGVRVWVSINIVSQLQQVQSVSEQVSDSRALASDLELQHSQLAATSRINDEAVKLGLNYSKSAERISVYIPPTIAVNKSGEISISDTVKNIEASAKEA